MYRTPARLAILSGRGFVNRRLNGVGDLIRTGARLAHHGVLIDVVAAQLQRNIASFQHLAVIAHLDLCHDLGVCGVALLEIYPGTVAFDSIQMSDVGVSAETVRVIVGAPVAGYIAQIHAEHVHAQGQAVELIVLSAAV